MRGPGPRSLRPLSEAGVGEAEASAVPRGAGPERVQFSSKTGGSPGRGRGFLPHLAPRGSGGSGEPSGGLRGRGPGPPVWHMVGEGEGPASGASPEAVSVVVAVAPSSTEDSILNPSSGGAGGSGLRGISSPRGLAIEGVERETELVDGWAPGFRSLGVKAKPSLWPLRPPASGSPFSSLTPPTPPLHLAPRSLCSSHRGLLQFLPGPSAALPQGSRTCGSHGIAPPSLRPCCDAPASEAALATFSHAGAPHPPAAATLSHCALVIFLFLP